MASDNVTPIGPHIALPRDPPRFIAPEEILKRVEAARDRIFAAIAIVNLAEHASPSDVPAGEPLIRFALREAYAILDAAAGDLDSSHFEVTHA